MGSKVCTQVRSEVDGAGKTLPGDGSVEASGVIKDIWEGAGGGSRQVAPE